MSVTVIIVTWNSSKTIFECLNALCHQTYQDFEILVVDNDSGDNTVEIARQFEGVSVIQTGQNTGFARGNNIGFARCESELIALLNPDAYPEPTWLAQLCRAAADNPSAAAFGSTQLCEENQEVLDGIGDVYNISGLNWREGHGLPRSYVGSSPREIFSPCAAAALYRRQAILQTGGFDEDFFCYTEDMDLGFRLRLAGHVALHVPAAVVRHVGSASTGGQHSDFAVYHGHRNLVWAYIKNMPGVLFWLFLPLHLALNVFTVFWFSRMGKREVIVKAKCDAIAGIPKAWTKRRVIQRQRKASIQDIWKTLDKRLSLNNRKNLTKQLT